MFLLGVGQICVRFPLVANVVDALEEIFDVNRILVIFCGIEGWVLGVSCEVTLLCLLHAAWDDPRVLRVNVEALSRFNFVLGDDDGRHLRCEATGVLAFGDRPILVASNKHIRSVKVTTKRASLCLSCNRLSFLLAMITVLIVSAVPISVLCLCHPHPVFVRLDSSLVPKSYGLDR